jgi:RNA polymerase sigma factor (sigma-70 family)
VNRPPLTKEQRALAAGYAREAAGVARRLGGVYGMNHARDHLRSVAFMAVSHAAGDYDPAKGKFEPFAWICVTRAVLKAIRGEAHRLSFEVPFAAIDGVETPDPRAVTGDQAALCIDMVTSRVMEAFALVCTTADLRDDGETRLLEHETRLEVQRAVDALGPANRALVQLRYYEGLPWSLVAERLDLPERTAKDHDRKIRERLGSLLRLRGLGGP